MRIIILLTFFTLQAIDHSGQSLTWGKRISGPGHESLQDIGTDSIGNVYSIGWFNNTVDFDPSSAYYPITASASGGNSGNYDFHGGDIFIAKWDEQGNFIWARHFSCKTYNNKGLKIAVEPNGTVYATGYFTKDADFDPGPGTHMLDAGNGRCIFLTKLDPNGNLLWANQFGDTSAWSSGNGLKIDQNGDLLLTGSFGGKTDFDPSTNTAVMDGSNGGVFLCKFTSNGNLIWNKQFKLGSAAIDVDVNNNIFMTGSFSGTVDVDPSASVYNIQTTAGSDACILKLNALGNFLWAKSFFGGSQALALALDMSGNIYCTGYYSDTCDFDPGPGIYTISSSATVDSYVAKLDPTGNLVWVHDFDAQYIAYALSIETDAGGNVFIGGYFSGGYGASGTIDCDPGPGTHILSDAISALSTGFMCCWNKNGQLVWAGKQPGPTISWDWAIHGDSKNNVYFGGQFYDLTDIDPFSTVIQFQAQSSDAFLCKAFTCTLPSPLTGTPIGPSIICEGDAATVTYTADPNIVWFNAGIAIGTGTSCTTPGLTSSTNTLYVRPENSCGINPESVPLVVNLSTCVSLLEKETKLSLKIYPNPSSASFVIDVPENSIGKKFFITNANGQVIYHGTLIDQSTSLALTLPQGIYLLQTSDGQSFKFSRL